jgi:hypothetical protein
MKIISTLARVCLLTLSLVAAAAQGYAILDVTDHLVGTDPIQMGRLSRNAIPQDWAGSEPFPGVINGGVAYQYRTYSVSVGASQYVQIFTDASGGAAGVVFTSAYLGSYDPTNKATNWLGDAGSSGNFFSGTDPNYFNVLVPANSTIIVVINATSPAALNQNYRVIVEGYLDASYASLVGTTTSLASSLPFSTNGAPVTFTSSVNGSNPTGTIDFRDAGVSIPGCGAQPLLGGGNSPTATCNTSSLALGAHPIQAFYSGDPVNAASSSVIVNQVVNPLGGTLACAPNPQQEISNVQCVLTLAGNNPTGTVTFLDGVSPITGCVNVALAGVGNTKTATCNTTGLSVGPHTITTTYTGDSNNPPGPSSNSVNEVITPRPATTTTVMSSMNPSPMGAPVTFTANIAGAGVTGTVQFKDGATIVPACSARPVVAASASCTIPGLGPGVHTITGAYSGDINNAPSSGNVMQTVTCVGRGCPAP